VITAWLGHEETFLSECGGVEVRETAPNPPKRSMADGGETGEGAHEVCPIPL
jgi:hypothetical protein